MIFLTRFKINVYDPSGNLEGTSFDKLQYAIESFMENSKKGSKLILEIENLGKAIVNQDQKSCYNENWECEDFDCNYYENCKKGDFRWRIA